MLTVEQEQSLAQEIMDKMYPFCTYVCCAGGAPRDWYDGNTCNDIDIYFSLPKDFSTVGRLITMFDKFLPELNLRGAAITGERMGDNSEMYSTMENLRRILTTEYKGKTIQLIQLEHIWGQDVLQEMDASNCQISWREGRYETTNEFKIGYLTNTLIPIHSDSTSCGHFKKMQERFPDKVVMNKERALKKLLNTLME